MGRRFLLLLSLVVATLTPAFAQARYGRHIEIDLQDQMAYLIENGLVRLASPISSGRAGHLTATGEFTIVEKERNHYSNLYGKIVDARGNVVVADADADMKVPRGGKFIPAPMRYFMRFNGATGMHAGYLPGYPASHACVRLPENNAIALFNSVEVGTPVMVFGRTPTRRRFPDEGQFAMQRHRQQPTARGFDPRLDPRYFLAPPGWGR